MPRGKRSKTAGPTILDYLHDDCWKLVLDYVDVGDVMLSERVSRRWQAVVLRYMETVRLATYITYWPKTRCLQLNDADDAWSSFKQWTEKLGSTVVVAYCTSESHLKILIKNCPNMEAVMIMGFKHAISRNTTTECFQRLRTLIFRTSLYVNDRCVGQLLNSRVTELDVNGNEEEDVEWGVVRGRFLNQVQSKLESLTLINIDLEFHYLLSVVDWLSELKRLHICPSLNQNAYDNMHQVLDKTTKLEYLHLQNIWFDAHRQSDLCKHLSRLPNLRHLSGRAIRTDEQLEVVTRGCKELRTLEIKGQNEISVLGLQAIVRNVGTRLVALDLGINHKLTNDDLMVCFGGCIKLTSLTAESCGKVSWPALREPAEAARRGVRPRPPPLLLNGYCIHWRFDEPCK